MGRVGRMGKMGRMGKEREESGGVGEGKRADRWGGEEVRRV